jgi:hypothetical protein
VNAATATARSAAQTCHSFRALACPTLLRLELVPSTSSISILTQISWLMCVLTVLECENGLEMGPCCTYADDSDKSKAQTHRRRRDFKSDPGGIRNVQTLKAAIVLVTIAR